MTRFRIGLLEGALALGLCLVGGACTDNITNIYYPGTGGTVLGTDPVTGTIGQEGGTLKVTDPANPAFGSEIVVPPGGVEDGTEISIAPVATVETPVAGTTDQGAGIAQGGPIIHFGPETLQIASGLTFQVAVPAPIIPTTGQLRLLVLRDGNWSPVPNSGDAGDGTVVGQVDTLGLFVAGIVGGGPPPPDTTPPTFDGVSTVAAGPGFGQLTLSWSAATDDQTASAAIVYYVWISPASAEPDENSTPVAISDPGALSIIIAGGDSQPRKYLVRARDLAGNFDTNRNVLTYPPAP